MKGLIIRRKRRRLTRRKNRRTRRRVLKQRGGSAPETGYFDATKVGPADPNDPIDGSVPRLGSAYIDTDKIEPEEPI
jgi:hypothetical protein